MLLRWNEGDQEAFDQLLPLVYDQLKKLAHARLRGERLDHTLNTTGLVHEAYLKLVDINQVQWKNQAHFLAMASRAMRRKAGEQAARVSAHGEAIGHFRRALSLLERLAEKLLEEGLNGSQAARGQDTQNQKGALHRTLLGIG